MVRCFLLILLLFNFIPNVKAQRSGIKGQIYVLPTKSNAVDPLRYQGVPLELFVYELTSGTEVGLVDGVIKNIYTKPITRAFSKWNGSFKIKLPPGEYSVFVRYQNGFYGNLTDSKGNLSPALVKDMEYAWVTVTLDYISFH